MVHSEDFQKKKIERLDCDNCGYVCYVFFDFPEKDFYTVCQHCKKRIYKARCINCRLDSTFTEVGNYLIKLNKEQQTWICTYCHSKNRLSADSLSCRIENYSWSQIPKEDILRHGTQSIYGGLYSFGVTSFRLKLCIIICVFFTIIGSVGIRLVKIGDTILNEFFLFLFIFSFLASAILWHIKGDFEKAIGKSKI